MKRNRLSRLGHSAVSSPVNLLGSPPSFSAIATLFHNPLALLGALFLCLAPALASAQGVSYAGTAVNFGSINVCPAGQTTPAPCSSTQTLTYSVNAGTTIGGVSIFTTGAKNLDFQAKASDTSTTLCSAQTYSSATTCTVDVTFAPIAPGERNGAVQIVDGSGNVLASTSIYGTGVGPALAFSPIQLVVTFGCCPRNAYPTGLAVDASGNLFVTFTGGVREVLAAGGYATSNELVAETATGPAVDGSGNVFLADGTVLQELLAVNGSVPANATPINLVTGFSCLSGTAVDGHGNVFVLDPCTESVSEVLAVNGNIPVNPTVTVLGGGDNTGKTTAIAVDASANLYLAGPAVAGTGEVREILAEGGYTTVKIVAQNLFDPSGVAVDAAGDLFLSSNIHGYLKEILAVNGSIPAKPTINILLTNWALYGIAVDGRGNVFLTDVGNDLIWDFPRSQLSLGFDPTAVGSTSSDSPQSAQIQNVGNATLTGSGILSHTTDFTVVPGSGAIPDCNLENLSVAPGAECNLSFDFTPQSAGALSATLSFPGTPATQTIQLSGNGQISQTITFNPVGPQVAGTDAALVATASSGLPVYFASTTPTICATDGVTVVVTYLPGYCNIQATQAGDAVYFPATTGQTFLVHHANQTIDFPDIPPQPALASLALVARASSGLPVAFASTTPTICTVSGNIASFLVPGYCDILVTQAGNAYTFAAISGHKFEVHHADQKITFDPIAPQPVGTMLTLTATTTSGLPITFASTTPTICTVSGSTASLLNTGTCTIQASQAGNATYFHSGPVTVSFTVE